MSPSPARQLIQPGVLPTAERLLEILEIIPTKRVLVVGDLLADVYVTGRTSRISREAPVLILRRSGEYTVPGQAANTAANLADLGARVLLTGATGDDGVGGNLLSQLAGRGVDLRCLQVPGGRTLAKTRVLAGGNHTTVQQVIRIDDDEGLELQSHHLEQRARLVQDAMDQADAVAVCDYGYGFVDNRLWNSIKAASQDRSIPLILDSRYALTTLTGAAQITPNEEEGLAAAGIASDAKFPDLTLLRERLLSATGAVSVLLTRGNEGMVLFCPDASNDIQFPVFDSQDCRDVTGAGDTVAATNAAAQAAGATQLEAAVLANIAGSIVVQKVGTATTTASELRQAIVEHYEDWVFLLTHG
jgi:rfaE bifunctional protein kinase chain/domain